MVCIFKASYNIILCILVWTTRMGEFFPVKLVFLLVTVSLTSFDSCINQMLSSQFQYLASQFIVLS